MHVLSDAALERGLGDHIMSNNWTIFTLTQSVVAGELHHVHVAGELRLRLDHDRLRAFLALVVGADANVSDLPVVLLSRN